MIQKVLFVIVLVVCVGVASWAQRDDLKTEADKLFNEGNALFKSGNYSGAIGKYDSAIKLFRDDFRYYYQRGLALKNTKQFAESIESFKESIGLKSDFAIGYNALGGVYLTLRQFDNAISAFSSALQYDKNLRHAKLGLAEAFAGKGQDLINAGKFDDAISILLQATLDYSDNSKLYLLLAAAYNKMDKPKDAVEAAENAIKYKKKGSKGAEYFELGVAYKKLGQKDMAKQSFVEARKDPTYARNAEYELEGLR